MDIDSIEEINGKISAHDAPSTALVQKRFWQTYVFWLLLLSSLTFFSSSYLTGQLNPITGDEPHYLVISQTLLIYHSLDVTLDYSHGDYKTFYRGPLGPIQHTSPNKWGQLLPLHSIGAPILWLLPFAIAGRQGALFFMAFVSVLVIYNIYLLLISLGIQRNYAFLTSLSIALASPIWVFSHHNFVEPIAALLTVYVMRILFQKHLRPLDLVGCSLALGLFPWIHIRFALFEAILCVFLLVRLYQEHRFNKIKPYLFALLPLLTLFFIFEAYNFFVWGSLNPAVNQANSGETPFDVAPWRGLLGLFIDQESGLLPNFPIFLFLLGGIILACKKRFLRFNLLFLLLAVPYIVTIASFHNWSGAISPPARFITVLVPPLAFYLALALQKARNWIVNGLFLLFIGISMLYEVISFGIGGWMSWQEGRSRPLLHIEQALHIPLTKAIPSAFLNGRPSLLLPDQAPLVAAWFAVIVVLALLVVLLARRSQPRAEISQSFN